MSCPNCGARAEEGQLVCLECGSRVTLGYRRPPSWRVPVAIVIAVLFLAVAGTTVALKKIGDDADREVGRTPIKVKESKGAAAKGTGAQKGAQNKKSSANTTAAEKPAEKPAEKKPAEKKERPTTGAAPASGTELVKQGVLYSWPRDLKGFTVVLLSAEDRASAENFARSANKGGPAKLGVIRADDFKSLPKGFFVVFAGEYKDRPTADEAAARLGKRFSGAFPQLVER